MAVFHSQLNAGQATEACRVHVLVGSSQPHLLIADPLQDARKLKEKQDELIALQNAGLESQQSGQLGLAAISVIITLRSEHSELEQLVRHGWFGSHPYRRWFADIKQPEGAEPEAAQKELLEGLQSNQQLESVDALPAEPDLSNEFQAFTRQLFRFNTELKVYDLNEPSMVSMDQRPPPRRPLRIVELYVQLGAFAPVDTLLEGELTLSGQKYDLSRCYVVELRPDPNWKPNKPPQALRILLEVHENLTYGRISAEAWLDPDGSGQLQIPERPVTCRWDRKVANMAIHEWERLKDLAVQKPLGLPQDSVLIEDGLSCRWVSREEAWLRPFLSQGGY